MTQPESTNASMSETRRISVSNAEQSDHPTHTPPIAKEESNDGNAQTALHATPVEKPTPIHATTLNESLTNEKQGKPETTSQQTEDTNRLKQQLEDLLVALPSGLQLKVYNVRTQRTPFKLYPEKQTTVQHHLILVTGQKQGTEQLICGIESDEFETGGEKTLYIGKVDSTGMHRGVISKVIQAYVKSETPCRVHVFARSQPQYLFHRSALNKDKPVLSDRDLIRWWYKVLSLGIGWWSIPGIDDEASARHELGRPKQDGWKYGYPYDSDAQAAQVVPRFNDDAKSRLLNKGEDMSVKEFWTMLGIVEECSHHLTGFFVVDVDGRSDEAKVKKGIDGDEYTLFWNYFMDLSFEDSGSVTESTRKFVSKWKEMGFDDPAQFVTRGPAYSSTGHTPNQVNVLSTIKRKPAVNTLSTSSIRRRPESVNTLSVRPKRPRRDD